jgi:hypothetical protein
MSTGLTSSEEAQLAQTVEMFEVITQTQPQDYQSLEILKEAYLKLAREDDVIRTSKRIAEAYVMMGQLSSAILEYEGILQRHPEDTDVLAALAEIESKANTLTSDPEASTDESQEPRHHEATENRLKGATGHRPIPKDVDDGREQMIKLFVDGKVLNPTDFELYWPKPDFAHSPKEVVEPFIHQLAEKGLVALEHSLKLISDKGRIGYLPLGSYDYDIELARSIPADISRRWCVLPFDRMSKSILIATANPFNRQAALELEEATQQRLLFYLAPPPDIIKALRKVLR